MLTGLFEAHLTVDAPADLFGDVCSDLSLKQIMIELAEGVTPSQPMTASFHRGPLPNVIEDVQRLAATLEARGVKVTRTKIEAHGPMAELPETDEDAGRAPAERYFEFHVKLALPVGSPLDALMSTCRSHHAHLSRNAHARGPFQEEQREHEERFVTLRAHGVGRRTAETRFIALCDALGREQVTIKNRIREYTVFDSYLALDHGWL